MKVRSFSVSTSFAAALMTIILLKIFDIFHFIKWNPIGYAEKLHFATESIGIVKWVLLFLFIWIVCLIFYYISLIFMKIPVSITSLAIGILLAILMEWVFLDKGSFVKTLKVVSIPFICIVTMLVRFIMESAIFQSQDQPLSK